MTNGYQIGSVDISKIANPSFKQTARDERGNYSSQVQAPQDSVTLTKSTNQTKKYYLMGAIGAIVAFGVGVAIWLTKFSGGKKLGHDIATGAMNFFKGKKGDENANKLLEKFNEMITQAFADPKNKEKLVVFIKDALKDPETLSLAQDLGHNFRKGALRW